MKKLVILFAALSLMFSTAVFANDDPDFILIYNDGYQKQYVVVKVGPNGEITPWE